ncbi:hypothetical protein VOLCADRAFT_104923 [Volvox carteri f. nagariensis]|uniref:Uncharacterized protein n=1 Tax=Volvox carteri f. nagariensis TaxID=3068 RepID=D8TX41_VOLCA|nr:uncharacterized protein VOLCADRAFT_104923 [Volvox carteri f. nagariensis]EFJ47945.1 hypothetical protein VOLCADRAFT_104923 [Volvox carteri f. nagariensis]|eukprot:XP_002951051.1 hypothetical protein VOLCADRAFT_104923 [Volvox carteri f. nagariensis]
MSRRYRSIAEQLLGLPRTSRSHSTCADNPLGIARPARRAKKTETLDDWVKPRPPKRPRKRPGREYYEELSRSTAANAAARAAAAKPPRKVDPDLPAPTIENANELLLPPHDGFDKPDVNQHWQEQPPRPQPQGGRPLSWKEAGQQPETEESDEGQSSGEEEEEPMALDEVFEPVFEVGGEPLDVEGDGVPWVDVSCVWRLCTVDFHVLDEVFEHVGRPTASHSLIGGRKCASVSHCRQTDRLSLYLFTVPTPPQYSHTLAA